MPKPQINQEVNKKKETTEDVKPNETVTQAPEVPAEPTPVKTGVTFVGDVKVPKDVELEAAVDASKAAAEKKALSDEEAAVKSAALKGHKVNADDVLKTVGESKDLIKAVKEDAEKRGKAFSVCPISGVLVVG